LEDPDPTLLKITVEQAEYWDAPSSKIVALLGIVKTLATGKRADLAENE
jgi:general stress protein 26